MKKKDGNNQRQSYILTRETLGMTILLFSALVFIILLTNKLVFAGIGKAICTFMYGTFGYASYIVVALCAYLGFWLVFEKKLNWNKKAVSVVALTAAMLFLLFHTVSTNSYSLTDGYGSYLANCYLNAENGYSGYTFGGVICGLIVYPIAKGTTFIGAYVIFSILSVLCFYLTFLVFRNLKLKSVNAAATKSDTARVAVEETANGQTVASDNLYSVNDNYEIVNNQQATRRQTTQVQLTPVEQAPVTNEEADKFSSQKLGRKILFENDEFAAESYRRNMIFNENSYFNHPVQNDNDYLSSFSSGNKNTTKQQNATYTESYTQNVEQKPQVNSTPSYIYGDKPVNSLDDVSADSQDLTESTDYSDTNNNYVSHSDSDEMVEQDNNPVDQTVNKPADDSAYRLNTPDRTQFTRQVDNQIVNTSNNQDSVVDNSATNVDSSDLQSSRRNIFDDNSQTNSDFSEVIRRTSDDDNVTNDNAGSGSLFSNLFSSSNSRLNSDNQVQPDTSRLGRRESRSNANLFDDDNNDDVFSDEQPFNSVGLRGNVTNPADENKTTVDTDRTTGFVDRSTEVTNSTDITESTENKTEVVVPPVVNSVPVQEVKKVETKPVEEEKPKHVWKKYVRPNLDLLDDYPESNNVNTAEIEDSKKVIVETLSNFRIASHVANVVVGPAITRYDVIIEDKTNIKNALKYKEAIAMALMKENVNAYLNYSKGAISFEVPNSSRTVVGLKSMLASGKFINCKENTLTFALGKNVEGEVVCPDITKMPHLLVAGTTGSGKSICLSSLIVSLLYKYGPEELRFILVDPKQVEFISYDKLPHLMINEIIYDVDKAIKALNWAIKEMERRYQLFKEMTEKGIATKNLTEYNAHLQEGEEKLPKIVVILDEFGDLMMQAKKEIETRIIRLVQKARACGIHLILATQRPSVDCITGLIKSNLPTRIGFKVNSFDDARTIFDVGGAEKLLGKGDLYFRSGDNPDLVRIQGCFIDTHEVQRVTDYIKKNNETYFDQSVSDFINTVEEDDNDSSSSDESVSDAETKIDDTFIKALKFCVTSNQASVSMIQRRFPVGYIKACKIIDWMENMNYVTQSEGSKPRKVLLSKEEFIKTYGDVDD